MNQILKPKQIVQMAGSNLPCEVEKFLGGGGQGEVYRALLGGRPMALKWYFPASATREQLGALETLIRKGPPNDRFLWPLELASARGVAGFGYIMPLREARYKGIVDMMKRRVEPSFRALATAGMGLADSYLRLHSMGLCYRDISFGNVFFDPNSGEVLICDNDNVAVDGQTKGGVLGTPRFMAPEVVRGEALPSTQTDLFSLAVLLFYVFMVHHPLEGKHESSIKCLDLPAMTKLYGTAPLFVFDPKDSSNAPVSGYHDNALAFWPIYPQFLRDLFTKAFTDGIRSPQHGRVRESEWRAAMIRLRDSIFYCSNCGVENFCDAEAASPMIEKPAACWSCRKELLLPVQLVIGRRAVWLNHDTQLFPHHVDDTRLYDFSQPVASVSRHPTDPNLWGLKNLTSEKWVCALPDGKTREVETSRSAPLTAGLKIQFGKSQGEIRVIS